MRRGMAGALERVSDSPAMRRPGAMGSAARTGEIEHRMASRQYSRRIAERRGRTTASSPRWAILRRSGPAGSSPPGSAWCPGMPAVGFGSESQSAGTRISALCWSMVPAPCSPEARRHQSGRCASPSDDRPTWSRSRWPTRRLARSGPCWPMTGRTRRTSSARRHSRGRRRKHKPTQEVAAERLRKARQDVMANRSDRDPPSLHRFPGEKPTGGMRRGSADPIRASGHNAPHR